MKSFVEFLKGLFKIGLVGSFVLLVILADVKELSQYQELSIAGILDQLFKMIKDIIILVTIIMAMLGAVDFAYQKYEHMKELKMTKKEIKDECKEMDGDPHVKAKLRQLREEKARQRMIQGVPDATVIMMNPTHYAVALKYNMDSMDSPVLIAKGMDAVAFKIKEIGEEKRKEKEEIR